MKKVRDESGRNLWETVQARSKYSTRVGEKKGIEGSGHMCCTIVYQVWSFKLGKTTGIIPGSFPFGTYQALAPQKEDCI